MVQIMALVATLPIAVLEQTNLGALCARVPRTNKDADKTVNKCQHFCSATIPPQHTRGKDAVPNIPSKDIAGDNLASPVQSIVTAKKGEMGQTLAMTRAQQPPQSFRLLLRGGGRLEPDPISEQ